MNLAEKILSKSNKIKEAFTKKQLNIFMNVSGAAQEFLDKAETQIRQLTRYDKAETKKLLDKLNDLHDNISDFQIPVIDDLDDFDESKKVNEGPEEAGQALADVLAPFVKKTTDGWWQKKETERFSELLSSFIEILHNESGVKKFISVMNKGLDAYDKGADIEESKMDEATLGKKVKIDLQSVIKSVMKDEGFTEQIGTRTWKSLNKMSFKSSKDGNMVVYEELPIFDASDNLLMHVDIVKDWNFNNKGEIEHNIKVTKA